MHFVGMLAAPIPADTVYLVLPTIISFLICALVVGISLFFVSIGEPSLRRVVWAAVLLGAGIASMHYVGIHGLSGNFAIAHDTPMVLLSIVIAIVTAYGGLRAFLARQDGVRLIAELDRVRRRGVRHALHRDARHAFCPAVGGGPPSCRRAGGVAANARGDRRGAVFCHCRRIPAVAGAGPAPPTGRGGRGRDRSGARTGCRRSATRVARAGRCRRHG